MAISNTKIKLYALAFLCIIFAAKAQADITYNSGPLWAGGVGTDFYNPANWEEITSGTTDDLKVELASADEIYIPNGCSFYPEINENLAVNCLKIESGASISLNGHNLTVSS